MNTKLVSHRGLFQKELDKNNGIILHLGNKDHGRNGFFFGSELIDWDFKTKNKLLPYKPIMKSDKVQDILKILDKNNADMFRLLPDIWIHVLFIIKKSIEYSLVSSK